MKLDIICNDGSPLGVTCKTIYGEDGKFGVGGAELALLTLCEAWHKAGHEVVLYNNPRVEGGSPFAQRRLEQFDPKANRDVLIVFRSPNPRAWGAKGLKVWFSCDQMTCGDFRQFRGAVDKVVGISPFHARFFAQTYGIQDMIVIDLPVRVDEYDIRVPKIPKRCIFTSVPDRGLSILRNHWPTIRKLHPDATLVITSDYRLWGVDYPGNEQHRAQWFDQGNSGVFFKGAVNRRELVRIQKEADLHIYPCTYNELFCIAVAESQIAGAVPITSDVGALASTNMIMRIPGDPNTEVFGKAFVEMIDMYLRDKYLCGIQTDMKERAWLRFNPLRILQQWNEKVFQ